MGKKWKTNCKKWKQNKNRISSLHFGIIFWQFQIIFKAFLKHFKDRGLDNKLVPFQLDPSSPIPDDGVAVLENGKIAGRVTSSRMSPTMKRGIGLAWVRNDMSESGNNFTIRLADGQDVIATVLDHAAYDPEGLRLKS